MYPHLADAVSNRRNVSWISKRQAIDPREYLRFGSDIP